MLINLRKKLRKVPLARKVYKAVKGLFVEVKADDLREHSDYIEHMRLYKDLTAQNHNYQDFKELLASVDSVGVVYPAEKANSFWQSLAPLFKGKKVYYVEDVNFDKADIFFVLGVSQGYKEVLDRLYYMQARVFVLEETFLRSVLPGSKLLDNPNDKDLFRPVSYFFDTKGPHFYPGITTSIEYLLNSDEKVPAKELKRCENLIKKVVENKLSKYNCQPIKQPNLPAHDGEKVLVIDQAYRDFSVAISGGVDESFTEILNAAISENPKAQIIVKTHVDQASMATYFTRMKLPKNVVFYNQEINPTSLIECVDKVYVYSSAVGWEALLAGKEVHVFGSPIYAGWGLTNDRRSFKARRLKQRTLAELFYFIYIKSSVYVNPQTQELVEIEEALDFLIDQRDNYFKGIK